MHLQKCAKHRKRQSKNPPKLIQNTANNFSSDVWKQLLIANDRNRVRWVVLGLSHDGATFTSQCWVCLWIYLTQISRSGESCATGT
jgi:hypothetical protein